ARIEAEPCGVDDHFGERGDVFQSHIQSLPRNRMNDMRRVADERDALGNELARNPKAERKNAARADRRDLPEGEAEAALELVMEASLGQRHNPRRLLRLLGPDDRGAVASGSVAFERQDRERARRQEMLLGTPVMIALMRNGGDDGGL